MPTKKLHIVDGESTGGTLRVSGRAKGRDILHWKDALYSGPVPSGLSLSRLSKVRSRFWTRGRRSDEFEKRDAQLLTGNNTTRLYCGSVRPPFVSSVCRRP